MALFVQIKKIYKRALSKFHWHYLKMETIFMNSENSKTSKSHRFKLDLTDKLNLKDSKKTWLYYTWKNIKSEYNNNKFRISAAT